MDNLKEYIELKLKGLNKNKDFFEGQLIAYHDILDKISEHAPKPDNLVRIKDTTHPREWYHQYIGKAFRVEDQYDYYYFEVAEGDWKGYYISIEDCEIVNT